MDSWNKESKEAPLLSASLSVTQSCHAPDPAFHARQQQGQHLTLKTDSFIYLRTTHFANVFKTFK